MSEDDLIGGLADIEAALKTGTANQAQLIERLGAILTELRKPVAAPTVNVQAAAAPTHDWRHVHTYDERGRWVESISTRITKG